MIRKVRFLLKHIQRRIRKAFITKYGMEYYNNFCEQSGRKLEELLPQVPNIGKSIFEMNYYFIICYFAWFDTFKRMGQTSEKAAQGVWFINEEYFKSWPKFVMHFAGAVLYSGSQRKHAAVAAEKSAKGELPPFDWKIRYINIDKNTYRLDSYECAALKLGKLIGMEDIFPAICRMDYLCSHYFGNEFRRKGTLADGFDCCDSWFRFPGTTQWPVPMDIEGKK